MIYLSFSHYGMKEESESKKGGHSYVSYRKIKNMYKAKQIPYLYKNCNVPVSVSHNTAPPPTWLVLLLL